MQIHLNSIARNTVFSAVAGFFALFVAPGESLAQDDSATAVDEITVTARRREESLQDVPLSITAISGDYLERIGAVDIIEVAKQSPNVTLEVSFMDETRLAARSNTSHGHYLTNRNRRFACQLAPTISWTCFFLRPRRFRITFELAELSQNSRVMASARI